MIASGVIHQYIRVAAAYAVATGREAGAYAPGRQQRGRRKRGATRNIQKFVSSVEAGMGMEG